MRLLKIGSRTCPSCTANKRFDKDIAWQLGYDLVDIYKGTADYDTIKSVREQFTGKGWKLPFPTYVFVDDALNILGSVSEVTTAVMFKAALQACLKRNPKPKNTISLSFPGEIKLGNRGAWGNFMSANAIGFRDSNANGATDSASTTFTGVDGKEVSVTVAADNADAGTSCTINGQTVRVGRLGEGEEETSKITLKADNTCDVKIVNKYEPPEEGGDDFNVNPMGIAIAFDYGSDFPGIGNSACSENGGTPDGCTPTTVLSEMNDQPRFYTHVWDRSKISSVAVLNIFDDQEHRLVIEFNRNVCDLPDIAESVCLCSDKTAAGGTILQVNEQEVEQLSETVFDYFFYATVNQTDGNIKDKAVVPACLTFYCCNNNSNNCEEGRPDGNIDIGDGDGDGLGDCDKRPTPEPVPGSNDRNPVYLYDRLNHTYIFCCPIKADVTWLLPFDTLPPVFQRYITAVASVRVAAQMINNPQLFQLLKDRENTLRMECMNYELEQGDLNFLNQPDHSTYLSYQTMQTLNR